MHGRLRPARGEPTALRQATLWLAASAAWSTGFERDADASVLSLASCRPRGRSVCWKVVHASGTPNVIPLVDLGAQHRTIKVDVDGAIRRVLDHGGFILGEEVRAFEASFAAFLGAPEAVGVASGTAALQLSPQAWGVTRGDEVITSAPPSWPRPRPSRTSARCRSWSTSTRPPSTWIRRDRPRPGARRPRPEVARSRPAEQV